MADCFVCLSSPFRLALVVFSSSFRCFFAVFSFVIRYVLDRLTNNERKHNERRTRDEREVIEKRTKNGWVLDEICGQMYVYLTLYTVCSVEIYECRDFYVAHEIFFIHGTISKGTPSKYLQVKLYIHYTNHILYVHYTNISTPTSPINCNLHFCHSIFWMNLF